MSFRRDGFFMVVFLHCPTFVSPRFPSTPSSPSLSYQFFPFTAAPPFTFTADNSEGSDSTSGSTLHLLSFYLTSIGRIYHFML